MRSLLDDDGCPEPDADHDGLAVACDRCPLQPMPASDPPGDDGCEAPHRQIRVDDARIQIINFVHFIPDTARITPASRPVIEVVAQLLRDRPDLERIAVVGHAALGERAPERLSLARAAAVRRELIAMQVDASRIEAHGAGARWPLTAAGARGARERDARVEFALLVDSGQRRVEWDGHRVVNVVSAAPPVAVTPAPARASGPSPYVVVTPSASGRAPTPPDPPSPPAVRPCPAADAPPAPMPPGGCPRAP